MYKSGKVHYGDRQPTNPLADAANGLQTPVIQFIIANQAQKNDKIPIKEAVKPMNPIVPEPQQHAISVPQKD